MNDKLESNMEAVWVELILHSQRVLIGTVYRHPKEMAFYDKFNTVLEGIWQKRKNIILLGDLNSDMKASSQEEGDPNTKKKLMRTLNNFDLRNVISNPTRVAANSEITIDLCVVSDVEKVAESGVLHLGVSDHSFIYACYKIKKEKELPYIKIVKDFKGTDMEKLKTRKEQTPWSLCSIFDDIDDCV